MNLKLINLVPQAYAAPVKLGTLPIDGVGLFQANTIGGSPCKPFGDLLSTVITVMTIFGSLAFVIYFTMGALSWITAGGDKGKIGQAQSQMTQSAIGLIAMVASYFIVSIVGSVLGIDILNPFMVIFGSGAGC